MADVIPFPHPAAPAGRAEDRLGRLQAARARLTRELEQLRDIGRNLQDNRSDLAAVRHALLAQVGDMDDIALLAAAIEDAIAAGNLEGLDVLQGRVRALQDTMAQRRLARARQADAAD